MKLSIAFFIISLVGASLCTDCNKDCRKIYDPYCLTYEDGTKATLSNKCVLEIEICNNGLNSKGEKLVGTRGACDAEDYSYYPDIITSDSQDYLDFKT